MEDVLRQKKYGGKIRTQYDTFRDLLHIISENVEERPYVTKKMIDSNPKYVQELLICYLNSNQNHMPGLGTKPSDLQQSAYSLPKTLQHKRSKK